VSRFADLSAVSSDAIPGTEPGLLTSSDGTKFGVVISYEVFFGARGISGIAEGGEVLLVPTNSASYETSQVPELTLAASQLQAVQTGRWVLQTSPTGYAAIVDSQGVVRTRTRLSDQTTIVTTVPRLTDSLPYVQFGDTLMIALAGTLLAGGRIVRRPTKREAAASAAAEPASADAAS
jgi:apolipoprotein N-acyltransferase